jgi:hypothetical protein
MEAAEAIAVKILSALGFQSEIIPLAKGKRADLKVVANGSTYYIEVKDKLDDERIAAKRTRKLKRGGVFAESKKIAHDNRTSGILRRACKQLNETPKHDLTFQLIWFHGSGIDADLKSKLAFATFYGQVALLPPWKRPNTSDCIKPDNTLPMCLYFDPAASYNMPTVEALIITDQKYLQLCLNEFSSRQNEFKQSALFQRIIKEGNVFDPVALANEGKIIACRANIPRKNDDEIAKALEAQTGVLYKPIRLTRYSCTTASRPRKRRR